MEIQVFQLNPSRKHGLDKFPRLISNFHIFLISLPLGCNGILEVLAQVADLIEKLLVVVYFQ